MAELHGVDITIGGLWHAGSYDPKTPGRLIGDKLGTACRTIQCTNAMMIIFLQVNSIDLFDESLDIDDSKTHLLVGQWNILKQV